MSKGVFRGMLGTAVTVTAPTQTFTTDRDPKEVTWAAISGSPANMRVTARGSSAQESVLFGLFPNATHVLYYDAADITLQPETPHQFSWTDAHSATRTAISQGPPESMGGLDGYMRVAVREFFE